MRIVLFGAPGVGKGTQATLLAEKYKLIRLSTGDLLRKEVALSSPTGKKAEQFIRQGHLVPDDIMFEIVDSILIENADQDILFDGFPRNLSQARSLEKSLAQLGQTIDIVIDMRLDEDTIVKRLVNRRYCPACGRIYNYLTTPPKDNDTCDVDRHKLSKRSDDNEDVIKRRLEIYEADTRPLVGYYKSLNVYREVNAQGSQEEVLERISEIVNGHLNSKCRSS